MLGFLRLSAIKDRVLRQPLLLQGLIALYKTYVGWVERQLQQHDSTHWQLTGAQLHFNLGRLLPRLAFAQQSEQMIAQLNRAVSHLQRAVELQPDRAELHDCLSMALFNTGQIEASVTAYGQYRHLRQHAAQAQSFDRLHLQLIYQELLLAGIGGVGHLDSYIKAKLLWYPNAPDPVLLAPRDKIPNPHYLQYWQRYITVISDPLGIACLTPLEPYLADRPNSMLQCRNELLFVHTGVGEIQQQWEAAQRPPLLTLTPEDQQRGWDCLQRLGVPADAWFVGLHVRESGFKDGKGKTETPRNATITSYLPAIQQVVDRGGWVIRMGDRSMQPLPAMERVIDYAHSAAKQDWMDVFLCAASRFFIGTSSGLYKVAISFGVPCVHTNYLPLHSIAFPGQDLYIPKLFWSVTENRLLSFAESLASPMRECYFQYQYDALGVNPIENTPDELEALVVEMLERFAGNLTLSPEDELLQQQFNALVKQNDTFRTNSRIGQSFLRKHRSLLNL